MQQRSLLTRPRIASLAAGGTALLLVLAALAGVPRGVQAHHAPGHGGGGGPTATPPPSSGGTSSIAFAKLITTGSGKRKTTSLQVIAAMPDGSNQVQVTSSGSNRPRSWSHDGWMVVDDSSSGLIRILNVPPSNPGSVTEVTSFAGSSGAVGGLWSAHSDVLGAILPASQQRIAFREGPLGYRDIVALRHDGSDPVIVASWDSTCIPSQSPGCTGSRYDSYLFGWLPTDATAETIRVLYGLREYQYELGTLTSETMTYRVATLNASAWPAATIASDEPILFGGAPVTSLNLVPSRDGTRVAYAQNLNAPSEPFLHVAPVEYDPSTGATTLRSDLAVLRADTTGTSTRIYFAGGFSPDNSQFVLQGITDYLTSGISSVFVSNAATSGPVVEVDGGSAQADSPIWGP